MNLLGIAYVVALLIAAAIGAALLLVAISFIIFQRTRIVGLATLAGAIFGAGVVVAAFVGLALVLSGNLRHIGSEMWPIWGLVGAAIGGLPAFVLSGAAKVAVAWIRSRKASLAAARRSASALEKVE